MRDLQCPSCTRMELVMTTWWDRASEDEKLGQIDAGIELGMTARQVGINVGATKETIHSFARYRGRNFPLIAGTARSMLMRNKPTVQLRRARRAYFSGEPVNLWGAGHGAI